MTASYTAVVTLTRLRPVLNVLAAREAVRRALEEDIGIGDVTTAATIARDTRARAELRLKAPGVIAGLEVVELTFRELDPAVTLKTLVQDGEFIDQVPTPIAYVEGSAAAILSAERTALNFLQRMSGIATATHQMVQAVGGRVTILDTRKTVPGLRALDKYSVAAGGGNNHRVGLFDGALIKENHIRAAGGIAEAVRRCRDRLPLLTKIEVEVTSIDELEQALAAGAEVILLDNMSPQEMRQAAEVTAGRAQLEASGGITQENLLEVAASGVDFISSGALTHSVHGLDISLLVEL